MHRIFYISALILLAACSKNKAEIAQESLVQKIPTNGLSESLSLSKEARIACARAEECPENIGMLVASTNHEVLTCTSFLIGNDLILTNSHCIPDEIKKKPALCSERVKIHFPHSSEAVSCKELVSYSPNFDNAPDLALIRTEKTNRIPLILHTDGMDEKIYSIYKITPDKKAKGILTRETCESAINSFALPDFDHPQSPMLALGNCHAESGNSGSPILSEKGEAVGVLQARIKLGESETFLRLIREYLQSDEMAPLSSGTNLHCLNGDFSIKKKCIWESAPENNFGNMEDFLQKNSDLEKDYLEITSILPQEFRWKKEKISSKRLEKIETFSPECVLDIQNHSVNALVPTVHSKIWLNRLLQPKLEVLVQSRNLIHYSFEIAPLMELGTSLLYSASGAREISICR